MVVSSVRRTSKRHGKGEQSIQSNVASNRKAKGDSIKSPNKANDESPENEIVREDIEEDEEEIDESGKADIRAMLSGTCQIIHAGPLCIDIKPSSFSRYAKHITKVLQQNKSTLDISGVKTFTTEFTKIPGNNEFLLFKIYEQKHQDEASRRETFMGLFCGYSSRKPKEGYFNSPTFVYNGSSKMWAVLQPAFQHLFSCDFCSEEFTTMTIKHLTAVWIIEAVKVRLVEKHDIVQVTYTNILTQANMAQWVTVVKIRPLIPGWLRMIESEQDSRKTIRKIWDDLGRLLEADKFEWRRSLITKIAGHSFVLTSMGKFKVMLRDMESLLAILKQMTRAFERSK